jgi:transposase
MIMGYKVHLACDGEAEMPLVFTVAPANENEKKHAEQLLSEAFKKTKAKDVICDKQYSSQKIREFVEDMGAKPVIPYPANQNRGIKGLLRVDKKFRVHGPERLKRLYKYRTAVERVNSRIAFLLNKVTFKGLNAASAQVSYAILSMLFIAWAALKTGKPEKARSITYYV